MEVEACGAPHQASTNLNLNLAAAQHAAIIGARKLGHPWACRGLQTGCSLAHTAQVAPPPLTHDSRLLKGTSTRARLGSSPLQGSAPAGAS